MSAYSVPLEELRFVLNDIAGLPDVLGLPAFADIDTDIVNAVLDEHARFAEQELAPLNQPADREGARYSDGTVQTASGFRNAYDAFCAAGWQGLAHDAAHGGQGLPQMLAAAINESFNAACLSFALCPLLTDGVLEALALAATEEQQRLYMPPLLAGRWTGTMNLTEPQAGSDLALLQTRAVPQNDGSYRIHGQKIFITYGEHDLSENIVHLVLARVPDAPAGIRGISLFIVPKFLPDENGQPGLRNDVYCAGLEHKLGIHGSPTAVMLYGSGKGEAGEGARGFLIGEENRGLEYMFIMMNAARFAVGVQGVAVAERALQLATAYAAERRQGNAVDGSGGPVAIEDHPDVARMLGMMRGLTEGARALACVAAFHRDMAASLADASERKQHLALHQYYVPIVKAFATEAAVEVASLGIQVHGGMGYIEETGAAQLLRDARILPIYEGTTGIQANDFLGRKLMADQGAVAQQLFVQMRQTVAELRADTGNHADALQRLAVNLNAAVAAYDSSLQFVLQHAREDARAVFSGSVPLLMLAGLVHAGWLMARSAMVASQRLAGDASHDFYRRKFFTALQFSVFLLPRCQALASTVQQGKFATDSRFRI